MGVIIRFKVRFFLKRQSARLALRFW
ncbi:MAG: hypothetical protein ACD_24C00460G0002, partial [uncultured bacterium]